jgi:hypothetical protein
LFDVPANIRATIAVAGGLVLLSALCGAVAALAANARPAWGLFGFEVVVGVAAACGVWMAGGKQGRYREGPGLAAACIAGTFLVGSVLGYLSLQPPTLAGVGLKPFLAGRVLAAAVVAAAGAWCVLSRHPRSWRLLMIGVLLGAPVLAAAVVAVVPALRGVLAPITGAGAVAQMTAVVGACVVLGALLCASADFVIRAFELGGTGNIDGPPTRP